MAAVFGVADLDRLLALAKRYPIFPCAQTKKPLVGFGFHAASQDPAIIRAWWRQWPDALVGVPTGQGTQLVVVDYDPDKATQATHAWIAEHTDLLCSTRTHKTGRGGLHYLFKSADRYQTGVDLVLDGSPRKGIDLRANGGYIIWWPMHGGDVVGDSIAPVPADLIDERRFQERRDLAPLPTATPDTWRAERDRAEAALTHLEPDGYEFWIRVGMALHHASGGSDEGFALWHEWSAKGDTYDGIEDCRYHWASFGGYSGRAIGLGTIYSAAKAKGFDPTPPRQESPPIEAYADDPEMHRDVSAYQPPAKPKPPPPRATIDWAELDGREPPPRSWVVDHWMGRGPMLLAGAGGIGKSLLAQTIATALALGINYVDAVAEPQTVLMWSCEDDRDEIWRRQVAICRYFDVSIKELTGRLIIEPRLGRSNALFGLAFGQPTWTGLREELVEQVNDYRASVLFLDNIGQVYGGNENDRHHVTTFVNGLSGITEWPLSTVFLGHPAKMAGSEFSGSTAWENAVRMRWFLGTHLPDQPEAATVEDGVRYLAKRKTNYSVKDWRRLTYRDGALICDSAPTGPAAYSSQARRDDARRCVLSSLRKIAATGITCNASTASPDYLPKRIVGMKLAEDYTGKELAEAMNSLLLDGRLVVRKVGTYSNRTPKMGIAEAE